VTAAGDTKPTSVLSVIRVEDSLDVVAHLSEGVPRHWFMDNQTLAQFLANELRYGLAVAVESLILDTVNAVEGLGTQEYDTSEVTTLRKSLTSLETAGHEPGAFVLHPSDWETIELLVASDNAIEFQSLPFDPAARRLWGVPVVVTTAQESGTSHTLARGAVAVDTDGRGIIIDWSESSNDTDWSKNLIRARCEGRFAASVYQPLGVIVGQLVSGS